MDAEKNKDYYVGLDMGTNSLGWAVTDTGYQVCRKHKKALWGIRLFEEGKTAEERRAFRTSRRRTERRSARIDLLQELFAEEISRVDLGFYRRLDDSRYLPDDKHIPQKNSLFCDIGFTDKEYHKAYPTIYHLRNALMGGEGVFDVRLVYLAIHHIIKHRGHFLFDNFNVGENGVSGIEDAFGRLADAAEEFLRYAPDMSKIEQLGSVLKNKGMGVLRKTEALADCLEIGKEKPLKELCKLLSGGNASLSVLLSDEELKDSEANKLNFSSEDFEKKEETLRGALGERYELIEAAKELYDWSLLAELMGNCQTLSEAKIKIYEKHKEDLRALKRLLKRDAAAYKMIFNSADKGSYGAYAGICMKNGKKVLIEKRSSQEEFYDSLKKVLKKFPESEEKERILAEIGRETFLPKAVSKDNGVIPHQLHEQELRAILKKAEGYLPFLKERDAYGTVSDKIVSLLTFRIPYYVGPLNAHMPSGGAHPFAWAVRKDAEGHVYPWNFEEKVDVSKSAEGFIRRMTNKCTYLIGEDVLPKNSLLYSKFMVLNELNNVRLGEAGVKLTAEQKGKVLRELFMKKKKVTRAAFIAYLVREGILGAADKEIAGLDGDFKATMAPWIDMARIFAGEHTTLSVQEKIIETITLFGADKKMLEEILIRDFRLSKVKARELVRLKYEGWGRLSAKFLTGLYPVGSGKFVNRATGEVMNLITALEETDCNLMELLSGDGGYREAIDEENRGRGESAALTPQVLENMRVSPAVRRSVWQALSVIKEIRHIMGHDPKRIFVEMARGGETVKKRTVSRKTRLMELYKACKGDLRDWLGELAQYTEEQLRSDRLYLYYTQMGRCMYSGDPIDLRELWDANVYDVDHIYPQSLTADDSLDNRVLVKKTLNQRKDNVYPLSDAVQQRMKAFWGKLKEKGLISESKYKRLIRKNALTAEEKAAFIGRQLVETRQGTKAVAKILQRVCPDTEIVYVKAGNVSRFRQEKGFVKCRDVNDFHHAKDAYLNIVVGNVYYTKFTANPANFLKEGTPYTLNRAMYDRTVARGGGTAWMPGEEGTIATVRKWMGKNNILFTRQSFEQHGGLFDQNPLKKGKGQVPLKNDGSPISNIDRYGGYNNAHAAYFMLVQGVDKKGKPVRLLVSVPLHLKENLETTEAKAAYCEALWKEEGKFKHPQIIVPRILYNALFEINGFRMHLSGKSGKDVSLKNAMQLCVSEEEIKLIKRICKFNERARIQKDAVVTEFDGITPEALNALYSALLGKLRDGIYHEKVSSVAKTVETGREKFLALPIESQCKLLGELLHVFQCTAQAADLTEIGGKGRSGIITLGANISGKRGLYYIMQSPTGFFEKKIRLSFE